MFTCHVTASSADEIACFNHVCICSNVRTGLEETEWGHLPGTAVYVCKRVYIDVLSYQHLQ